jgi:hypothetical protein
MQAQSVWHVWRRIMREENVQQALWGEGAGRSTLALQPFGFDASQQVIALSYGEQADRAKWFVLNYRFRLVNSFLNALETGAPLVLRALLNKGASLNALAQEFLNTQQWKDFGPLVYTYCDAALEFLLVHEVTLTPCGLRDLIGLERTVVSLMRGLAESAEPEPQPNQGPLRRTPWAREFQSGTQLSAWLRDKKTLGRMALLVGEENYLVYLPSLDVSHKYALLPPRAMQILTVLDSPCPRLELPARLSQRGWAAETTADAAYLTQLKAQRAVCGDVS